MTIRAVLFDLDGTLVDSERESAEAMARVLERELGVRVSEATRAYVVGHSWNEIYAHLQLLHGPALAWSMEELIRRSSTEREHVIAETGLTIMPGAVEAVRRLGARYPKAIVTGSSRAEARQALRALGVEAEFPVVFASEDYTHGKPSPDGYLAAAAQLGVAPGECLVLEDSSAGIAAGRAAGALVVGIRVGNFMGQDQSAAHRIVETLDEITDGFLAELEGSVTGEPRMIADRLPKRATIYEVGPRDGLQNEARMVPTADKIAFIDDLSATGLPFIEITSFVNPKWIPQLADAVDVARGVQQRPNVGFSALVPNRKGLDSALAGGMREIAVFLSASETHTKKNINKTIAEALQAFEEVIPPALAAGVRVRAYVSTVYGCPYEGHVDPKRVVELSKTLRQMGVYQVSLGDTIGVANPAQVEQVLSMVLAEVPADELAMHFHDTRGTALANCLVGLGLGITTIDAAVGGLGGCPYAPGASGNLATEDVVAMLHAMGVETGIDLDKLVDCSKRVAALVGHELPSKYLKAHVGEAIRASQRRQGSSQNG